MKRLTSRHELDVYTLDTSDRSFCNLKEVSNAEFVFHFSPSIRFPSPFGRLNQLQRWRDLRRLDHLACRIANKIDSGKYDVVFAQPCMWTQAPLVLRYLTTPTIYYCHEPPRHVYESLQRHDNTRTQLRSTLDTIDPFVRLYQGAARDLDQSATQAAGLVLVNSIFIRDQVRKIYGIESTVSYHGVDTEIFHPETCTSEKPYVLSVGAIQPHKGFDFLVESLSYIRKEIRPALHLIGNMQSVWEQEVLHALAREKGVELQIEVGIDQKTLVQRYNASRLVVYAPRNEPFGLVPLEAMACGKPVIGIDEGGVKETVKHGFTGLLVDRNAGIFGEAIQSLLENSALIAEYGRNGRRHVLENWSWDQAVLELERHMYSLVHK